MPDTQNLVVVARNPGEMQVAQDQLISWAAAKIEEKKAEYAELQENYEIAVKNKWRSSTLKKNAGAALKRIEFYEKIHAALQEGYCIVPNMDLDVFAIRTTRKKPRRHESNARWGNRTQETSRPQLGDGRYVDADPVQYQRQYEVKNKEGALEKRTAFWADEFQEVGFPFSMAKPQILDATAKAMAKKVFDDIGVLPRRTRGRGDPMVIGRVVYGSGYNQRAVSFLISWFVDTKDFI
jgi:hypothetical protein